MKTAPATESTHIQSTSQAMGWAGEQTAKMIAAALEMIADDYKSGLIPECGAEAAMRRAAETVLKLDHKAAFQAFEAPKAGIRQ